MSVPTQLEQQRQGNDPRKDIGVVVARAIRNGLPPAILAAGMFVVSEEGRVTTQFDPGQASDSSYADTLPGQSHIVSDHQPRHDRYRISRPHVDRGERLHEAVASTHIVFDGETTHARDRSPRSKQVGPPISSFNRSGENKANSRSAFRLFTESAQTTAKGISKLAGEVLSQLPDGERADVAHRLNEFEYRLRHFHNLTSEGRDILGRDLATVLRSVDGVGSESELFDDKTQKDNSWAFDILAGAGILAGALAVASRLKPKARLNIILSTATILAACGPVGPIIPPIQTPPAPYVESDGTPPPFTPGPESQSQLVTEFNIDIASEAVKPWTEVTITGTKGERAHVVTPVIFIREENSEQLITVVPATDHSWEYTIGQARLSEESGKKLDPIRFLVGYKAGEDRQVAYALFPVESDANHVIFDVYELVDGKLVPASVRLEADRSNDKQSVVFVDKKTGQKVELVSPPDPSTPDVVPTTPPSFFDSLIALTAGNAFAAGKPEVLPSATKIPTEVLPATPIPPELTATKEVAAEFSIDPDVIVPAELGTPAIAVRWGPEGSFTISTKEGTPYTLVSPVGERPIFDTPEGKEFFFGLLAKGFGYESADGYLKAVSSGQAKTITLPQFGIQEGPVVLDPAKISIVFEATEVNDPDRVWFLGRLENHARKTGGWIRDIVGDTPKETSYYRFDIVEDGRVVIRIRTVKPFQHYYDLLGQAYYSYLITQGVYMLAVILSNGGKFPGPPEGFGDRISTGRNAVTIASPDGIERQVFWDENLWEFLGIPPFTKYSGPSDFNALP